VPPYLVDFLRTPYARLVVWLAVLAVLTVIGYYAVRRFRDGVEQAETVSDLLAKFHELRQRGHLSDAEFRTIKTTLGEKRRAELKRDSQQG